MGSYAALVARLHGSRVGFPSLPFLNVVFNSATKVFTFLRGGFGLNSGGVKFSLFPECWEQVHHAM